MERRFQFSISYFLSQFSEREEYFKSWYFSLVMKLCKEIHSLKINTFLFYGTCQKSERGRGWKTGEDHSLFEPFKSDGYSKNDRKRGRVTGNWVKIIVKRCFNNMFYKITKYEWILAIQCVCVLDKCSDKYHLYAVRNKKKTWQSMLSSTMYNMLFLQVKAMKTKTWL